METKISAGLIMYRIRDQIEVFLVHPGGPFYINKDAGVWTIPKGLIEDGGDLLTNAIREFNEETGIIPDNENFIDLGTIEQSNRKTVYAWAFKQDYDDTKPVHSNTFSLVWPPGTQQVQEFPEMDQGRYFCFDEAIIKINPDQIPLIERLVNYLSTKTK